MSGRLVRFKKSFHISFPPRVLLWPLYFVQKYVLVLFCQALPPFCKVLLFTVDFFTSILIE